MFVIYDDKKNKVPIKVWLDDKKDVEDSCLAQAEMVSNHPAIFHHLALMPDTHTGYALPIGGVCALDRAISPYFVGVDIGCGMGAVRTNLCVDDVSTEQIRMILDHMKKLVPVGEGHAHQKAQEWDEGFLGYLRNVEKDPDWLDDHTWQLAEKNLGTLGGGNHFIEVQRSDMGDIWLMIHSGSRNLGYKIAQYYHKLAVGFCEQWHSAIVDSTQAFLPADSYFGENYLRDMKFAMAYAKENRRRIMAAFKLSVLQFFHDAEFVEEINIHHNFASLENHYGKNVWIHRKGATSAKKGELGIIPGSMGTKSYIVEGKGNPESYCSCSHGAGRKMGRNDASRRLDKKDCDAAMSGIVFDGFGKAKGKKMQKEGIQFDLGEAPQAYKDIVTVIRNEADLITPVRELTPLGVLKG